MPAMPHLMASLGRASTSSSSSSSSSSSLSSVRGRGGTSSNTTSATTNTTESFLSLPRRRRGSLYDRADDPTSAPPRPRLSSRRASANKPSTAMSPSLSEASMQHVTHPPPPFTLSHAHAVHHIPQFFLRRSSSPAAGLSSASSSIRSVSRPSSLRGLAVRSKEDVEILNDDEEEEEEDSHARGITPVSSITPAAATDDDDDGRDANAQRGPSAMLHHHHDNHRDTAQSEITPSQSETPTPPHTPTSHTLPPPRNRSRSRSSTTSSTNNYAPSSSSSGNSATPPPSAPPSAFIDGNNARRLTRLYENAQRAHMNTTTTNTSSPPKRLDSIPARTSSTHVAATGAQRASVSATAAATTSTASASTPSPPRSTGLRALSHKDSFGGDGLAHVGPGTTQHLRRQRSEDTSRANAGPSSSTSSAFRLASIPQHQDDDYSDAGSRGHRGEDSEDDENDHGTKSREGSAGMQSTSMDITGGMGGGDGNSIRTSPTRRRVLLNHPRQPLQQAPHRRTALTVATEASPGPATTSAPTSAHSPMTGGSSTIDAPRAADSPIPTSANVHMATADSDRLYKTVDSNLKSVGSSSVPTGDSNSKSLGVSTSTTSATTNSQSHGAPHSSHRLTMPRLPRAQVQPAPPPSMYWSRAPIHGSVPRRVFRAHTATLCEDTMWLFGGCDSKGCFGSIWCFDVETMCWSKPRVNGDVPSPRRAHSATMIDRRLYVFGGGDGPQYYSDLYCFDTVSLKWSKPEVYGSEQPTPRRAHSANYWNGHIVIFGGGNGVGALCDVWMLDVRSPTRLEWKKIECTGKTPIGRGYHTGNIVDDKLIIIGGSDGHMSFNDIHILKLDTKVWYQVRTDEVHCRVGHSSTQVGSYLFIFGGHDSIGYSNEVLTLNLVNLQWENRKVCGMKPKGRGYHQAWLCDSRLFVHAGFDGAQIFDDLYFLDLAACSYLPQITQFSVILDDEEGEAGEVEGLGITTTATAAATGTMTNGHYAAPEQNASPPRGAIARPTEDRQDSSGTQTGGLSGIVAGGSGGSTSGVVRRAV